MKTFKITMWVLSVISILIMTLFLWCYFFVDRPQTLGVINISALSSVDEEDTPLEDATVFMNVNALNNKNENGQTLYEIQFNTYMGTNEVYKNGDANIHGYGFQFYNINPNNLLGSLPENNKETWQIAHEEVTGRTLGIPYKWNYYLNLPLNADIYSYEVSNVTSENSLSVAIPYNSNINDFVVSVKDGENVTPLMLRYRGYCASDINFIDHKSQRGLLAFLNWNRYFTLNNNFFLYQIMYTINNLPEGTHYFNLDLSDYFECRLYNSETKQFDLLTADKEYTWVTIKANVSDDGVVSHNQSMFGMIASNDGSVTFGNESTLRYWQVLNNITLTLDDFRKRKSPVSDGYYLYLSMEDIAELNKYKNNRVHINLSLKNVDKILGFDNYSLDGLQIHTCSISSNPGQDFVIMPNALDGTNLLKENISTKNVTLIDLGGIYE